MIYFVLVTQSGSTLLYLVIYVDINLINKQQKYLCIEQQGWIKWLVFPEHYDFSLELHPVANETFLSLVFIIIFLHEWSVNFPHNLYMVNNPGAVDEYISVVINHHAITEADLWTVD